MANWVQNIFVFDAEVSESDLASFVDEDIGFCRTIIPIPEEVWEYYCAYSVYSEYRKYLENPQEYQTKPEFIQQFVMLDENREKCGFSCYNEWADKVGCTRDFSTHVGDNHVISFESKWMPVSKEFLEKLAEKYPSFNYYYDEETGWGGEVNYWEGKETYKEEWDSPYYDEVDLGNRCVYRLQETWRGRCEGYYDSTSFEDFLGYTLEEAKDSLNC